MTVTYYGKRNPGSLTAASPGDTLVFPFASYNDSGDSEALSGLAVTDIEVLKDGAATVRATDSGYSLISDTGMVGDRVGLYRVRIQLFNTDDDATFYAEGSSYQAFVDSVTIDGKTVRFWLGTWEIGEPRANVVAFADTGVNDRLSRIGFDVDTGLRAHVTDVDTGLHAVLALQDTGAVATAGWAGDTGLRDHITNVDTGVHAVLASMQDTGGWVEVNIRKVNSVAIQGAGDTGTGNTWRPA